MYEWFSSCRERFVENSVESVEIHPKKRRQRWTFARSPQSFQLVEKTGPFYNLYTGLFVENITARKWDGYFARELATLLYTRARRLGEAGNSLEEKTAILWQRKSAYVILQDESISDSVTKTGNFQMQEASFHRN